MNVAEVRNIRLHSCRPVVTDFESGVNGELCDGVVSGSDHKYFMVDWWTVLLKTPGN